MSIFSIDDNMTSYAKRKKQTNELTNSNENSRNSNGSKKSSQVIKSK